MSFRIAVGGIVHETNTYCKDTTSLGDFWIQRGEEIIANHRGVRTFIGGMISAAEELGATLIPTFFAEAQPSGTIAREAYESMLSELLMRIREAMPVEAVALSLHGAGVVEGIDDLEGHLLQAVRQLVGREVKIVVTLDLHGNITKAMADAADMMFGVHFYPHTDMYERGYEAVGMIPRLLTGSVRPVTHVETVPMLLPPSTTNLYPASKVNELCREIENQPGILDCTFFHGFPYTDIRHVGVHITVTADGDREAARAAAREVARWVWDHREEFRLPSLTPEEAVARALAIEGGPVVINDTADNPGGGGPGDGTHLLRAMLEAGVENACFGFIYDPEVADIAHRAGVGATVDVELGGKHDDLHGKPVRIRAYVKCLTDGQFALTTPMGRGARMNFGKMARLHVGGVDIIVGSVRSQTLDPELFLLHGIDVTRYKIVALKSSQHFRAGFESIAKAIVTADSPGLTTLRVESLPRVRHVRPMWPLHPEAEYGR